MWPVAVVVGGVALNLDDVLSDVTIRQGRATAYEQAQASSAQLTLLDVTRPQAAAFTVGKSLSLDTEAGRRFTGYITDAQLDDDRLTVLAVGMLARYSRMELPLAWTAPAEPWSARVDRVIKLAGLDRFAIPWQAAEWYTVPAYATLGDDPGTPHWTFLNYIAATPAWGVYALPHAGDRNRFRIVKGERYRVTIPFIYIALEKQMLVTIDQLDVVVDNFSKTIDASGPWAWEFTAPANSSAAGARLVFYNLQDIPAGNWAGWQPITIERLPGYSVVKDSDFDPVLAAVGGTETSVEKLVDKLNELADDVGALVCDMPDGRLLVQALGGRTSTGAVSIDPADVRYAPPWIQVDDVANVVTVKYQGGAVALTDAGSVGVFDERPDEITTTIVSASDANLRAVERLSRAAYPRWIMPSCPLLRPYTFALGGMANVVSLPDASPVETWSAVVEGWTDTITGPDWEMDVALSDALQSGLVLPWNEVPVGIAWNAVPVDTDWNDATTLDAVTP